MGKTTRVKYDPSLKVKVVTEYFQGASAKEIYAKYGIKQRTVYDWSKKARKGILVSSSDKKGIEFLSSNVANDNAVHTVHNAKCSHELEEKIENLEDKVKKLEYVVKEIIQVKQKI